MSGALDSLVQYLLNRSKLDVELVRISEATEDSYLVSIQCNVSKTGPVSSTISPVEVDQTFRGKCFGKLTLPEINTHSGGSKVSIKNQQHKILDLEVYKEYVQTVLKEEETCFRLDNGTCTIRAMGVTATATYSLDVPVRGMTGPKITMEGLERNGAFITGTFEVQNPSPVEIDHGQSFFDLRNDRGQTLARLEGTLKIVRGVFDLVLSGSLDQDVEPSQEVRLVGAGVKGSSWCDATIKFIDVAMPLKPEMVDLLRAK